MYVLRDTVQRVNQCKALKRRNLSSTAADFRLLQPIASTEKKCEKSVETKVREKERKRKKDEKIHKIICARDERMHSFLFFPLHPVCVMSFPTLKPFGVTPR